MDCVKLYFKDNLIGILTYDVRNSKYVFVRNKFFKNRYIDEIMGLDDKEVHYSPSLFSFFFSFIHRYGKGDYENEYAELIRIASSGFDKNQFWLGV